MLRLPSLQLQNQFLLLEMTCSRLQCSCTQEKQRKDYTFWLQFNKKPSIIPGCPGMADMPWSKHYCAQGQHTGRLHKYTMMMLTQQSCIKGAGQSKSRPKQLCQASQLVSGTQMSAEAGWMVGSIACHSGRQYNQKAAVVTLWRVCLT